MRIKKVGEVGIDSGHAIIVDSGMARYVDRRTRKIPEMPGEQVDFPGCVEVVTGHGDGNYPVYAIYDVDGDYVGIFVPWFDDVQFPFEIVDES